MRTQVSAAIGEPAPSSDRELLVNLIELLQSEALPEQVLSGAWRAVWFWLIIRPALQSTAMEMGVIELAAAHFRAIGSTADAIRVSRCREGRGFSVLHAVYAVTRASGGEAARPDLDACVATGGVFDICIEVVTAFASAGVAGLRDTNRGTITTALMLLSICHMQPGCEAKLRGAAKALTFAMQHSLEFIEAFGYTSGACAAKVCCCVFGRDEQGSEFTFTQEHIDVLTVDWSQTVAGEGFRATKKPTSDNIFAVQLSVSDVNKPLLLANKDFIPYCVDALLLDPEHLRAGMKEELKAWCQTHHAEALAQLALFEPAREALLQDGSVVPALEAVAAAGLTEQARELAAAALMALSDRKAGTTTETEGPKHVMLSCEYTVCLHL